MAVFFFGLGFSSQAAATAFAGLGETALAGTTRSADKAAALRAQGIAAHVFDSATPSGDLGADLGRATHLVASIAPDAAGDPVLRRCRAALDAAQGLQWLCYYSTVGVYGDFGGAWVDENAPCQPANPRSRWRLKAEADWRAYAQGRGLPLAILRLAGIYGPGRSSFDKLAAGTARRIVKPGQVFNRIHVADIGRVTALAAAQKLDGVFNLADDLPAPPQEVVAHAAHLAGLPPPPEVDFATAELTPMARSFYADNKRVANGAIKRALGTALLYPTYRDGLAAIWRARQDPSAAGDPR